MKSPVVKSAALLSEESAREAWHAAELKLVRAERSERVAREGSASAFKALTDASVALNTVVCSKKATLDDHTKAERRESRARSAWHRAELVLTHAQDTLRAARKGRERAWKTYETASESMAKAGAA